MVCEEVVGTVVWLTELLTDWDEFNGWLAFVWFELVTFVEEEVTLAWEDWVELEGWLELEFVELVEEATFIWEVLDAGFSTIFSSSIFLSNCLI